MLALTVLYGKLKSAMSKPFLPQNTKTAVPQFARVYLRRQETIVKQAQEAGYHIAGTYREKASGARADRPELQRMIADLQPGDVVIAEKIECITRLPLSEVRKLIESIQTKGALLAVPGIVELTEYTKGTENVSNIALPAVQDVLLKLVLLMAHNDYEARQERQRQGIQLAKAAGRYLGRRADSRRHSQVLALRGSGHSIRQTAELTGYSSSQVKRICAHEKRLLS